MRQTFDETTDRSFGPKHVPLIRQAMADQGLDGFVIPHEDEHQNEYLPAANDRLAWATGFTGSAGAAVILKDKAAVFVDGRYTLQVRDQVDQGAFEIRDLVEGGVPAYLESRHRARPGDRLRPAPAQPRRAGPAAGRRRQGRRRAEARSTPNPLDAAWGQARPPQPAAPVVPHPLRLSPARTPPPSAPGSARPAGAGRRGRGDHRAGLHRLAVQHPRRRRDPLAPAASARRS